MKVPKEKKVILKFIEGFLLTVSIGIASKLVVMFIFSETMVSWISFIASLICAGLPAGIYSARAQGVDRQ